YTTLFRSLTLSFIAIPSILYPPFCQTTVRASCFFYVRWFFGRFWGALEQTHAAAKLWFECWLVRLGKCEAFTNSIKNNQVVSNCVAVKGWLNHISNALSILSFLLWRFSVLLGAMDFKLLVLINF